jgi:hypothetical protein
MLNLIMPKFNNQLFKSIYIAVNVFFLIAAPFNLGYYSYKLGQALQSNEVIEMPPLVAGTSTTATKATDNQGFLSDNSLLITQTAAPVANSNTTDLEEPNGAKVRGSVNVFFCINDSEAAVWEVNLDDNVIDRIGYQGPQDNLNGGLLIYCQSKTRIRDMASILMIKRIGATGDAQTLIDPNELFTSSYIVLSFDKASGSINYEVRSERPE